MTKEKIIEILQRNGWEQNRETDELTLVQCIGSIGNLVFIMDDNYNINCQTRVKIGDSYYYVELNNEFTVKEDVGEMADKILEYMKKAENLNGKTVISIFNY